MPSIAAHPMNIYSQVEKNRTREKRRKKKFNTKCKDQYDRMYVSKDKVLLNQAEGEREKEFFLIEKKQYDCLAESTSSK